ncbi:GNAT family N-acetyltransferase/hotdog fold thioesterase [Pseudoalteromonas luteoviolacea]|uniref:bifunctional GNAT family N-acetyltransferase/hotdog fold thioesterase n=1 Tax=Pseudoalteromonas luteoviolacea TaxID=43657 RepID=UPI001B39F96E|nr:bifunctional GNAT family N-acetyltransferase/hotdog fold thioesterase [Pseudoalteromonas luteoviolacea]MBQ4878410.1 GNAT family N-acetyltransferase/hotdog fold thioesterase [Pseudoalteromonas luteoviolacea]MBQ4907565.1 GNAT family N-acetyltransferase/hotdog fold thioesterase [Pseudoalteromonas luteoviolacea]
MFPVISPQSSQDWQDYYQLRWQVLRAPWDQPRGSEQDDLEQDAEHRYIKNNEGEVLAVARLHFNNHLQAQVRYMAVGEGHRGQHLGSRLLHELEKIAWTQDAQELVLFARERALAFYERHGYEVVEKAHLAYGDVQHWKMVKQKPSEPGWFRHPDWTQVLQDTWRESIPISDAMGIKVESYTDWQFSTKADLKANLNLHNSMFAGSVYSMATLTGWGATYLALKELNLEGDIVLADAEIKYLKPLTTAPGATVTLSECSGELSELETEGKAKYTVPVNVYDGDVLVAKFCGVFFVKR